MIAHRIYWALDHAHNARLKYADGNQRRMVETVFSCHKPTNGSTVRARSWYLEDCEMLLNATVSNFRRAVRYPESAAG